MALQVTGAIITRFRRSTRDTRILMLPQHSDPKHLSPATKNPKEEPVE